MRKGSHHKPKTRALQSTRITESLATIREQGKKLGRPEGRVVFVDLAEVRRLQRTCKRCGQLKTGHAHEDHTFRGYSLRDIAKELGISVFTLQVRLGKLDYRKYRSKPNTK
jgi:DNA invertase Pin-like site-specific DNA recombinase